MIEISHIPFITELSVWTNGVAERANLRLPLLRFDTWLAFYLLALACSTADTYVRCIRESAYLIAREGRYIRKIDPTLRIHLRKVGSTSQKYLVH